MSRKFKDILSLLVLDMRFALIRLSTLLFESSASADSANPAYGAVGGTRTLRPKRNVSTVPPHRHMAALKSANYTSDYDYLTSCNSNNL